MKTAGKSPVPGSGRGTTRRRPTAAALLALATAGTIAVAGCSAGGGQIDTLAKPHGQPVASGDGSDGNVASPTPSATPSVAPQNTSGNRAVLAANDALSASLFSLVSATNKAQTDNSVTAERKGMSSALGSARTALAAERHAAYGGVRSCARVEGNLHTVRSAAGRVAGLRTQLLAQTAKVRADLQRMAQARAQVVKKLSAMQAAAKAASDSSQSGVIAQVKAALTQESKDQAALLASVRAAEQKAASTVSNAYGIRANAMKIAAKAC